MKLFSSSLRCGYVSMSDRSGLLDPSIGEIVYSDIAKEKKLKHAIYHRIIYALHINIIISNVFLKRLTHTNLEFVDGFYDLFMVFMIYFLIFMISCRYTGVCNICNIVFYIFLLFLSYQK